MEIKMKSEHSENYFNELLSKIREIRRSERGPEIKILEVICAAIDNADDESSAAKAELIKLVSDYNYSCKVRLANYVVFRAERWATGKIAYKVENILSSVKSELKTIMNNQGIYDFPCFEAEYERPDEESEAIVHLPEELKDFKGHSMVLKIEDMDRLLDTFTSRDTYYRRSYAILADLDKEVLEGLENDTFQEWTLIPYKEWGDAIFEFSHFEVDLREPDEKYRTIYIVYRYDTTVS